MNRLFKFTFLFSALLFVGACTDLEDNLEDAITEEFSNDGVNDDDGGALLSSFARLRNGSAGHGSYFSIQGVSSDEMAITQKGGDWFDGGIWLRMHRHTYGSASGPLNDTWNDAYDGIGEVNTALEGALTPNETAQAKVLRAFFYFRLLDSFGRVKLITTSGGDAPQSDRTTVFNFVESELLDALGIPAVTAAMDLSGSNLTTDVNNYTINQFAALGLLSKLYLNAQVYTELSRWQEADWAASYIIDNGPYQLCDTGCIVPNLGRRPSVASDPDELEGYAAVFAPNNENNPEMIWAIEYDESGAGGMNFGQMTLHYGSQLSYSLDEQPWNGYVALEEFYNSYEDGDLRKDTNFLQGEQLDYNGDPVIDFAADDVNFILDYTPAVNELEPNAIRQGGTRLGKFSFKIFGRSDMDNDYPIIRLGQVHLIRAEARSRDVADWNMALPDVNALRARAGLTTPLGVLTADTFFDERGKEMFMESTRRQDLIRFGKWGDAWWEKAAHSDANLEVFPIPQEQIDASEGSLTQNPGY